MPLELTRSELLRLDCDRITQQHAKTLRQALETVARLESERITWATDKAARAHGKRREDLLSLQGDFMAEVQELTRLRHAPRVTVANLSRYVEITSLAHSEEREREGEDHKRYAHARGSRARAHLRDLHTARQRRIRDLNDARHALYDLYDRLITLEQEREDASW